ncbi:MAG: type I methionyl aminopeptidase [Bacteroidales bacterium]|jgi:methionyl aminopeptidase|nr:type I methionyl aminopeptidase [Lentimicrobiaceae bacterium]MDG1135893.1 type I methionyl aminopeptidase [Bacteroidales bacterium]MDG1902092.1 type I methionyl aminopeptidase [Bacteroidales bacterium]MDG2080481.1 type I methionyl aminopeptidase [Bacteroidales bacterium]|tara:strand:- start:1970 stop:2746 length:777 start_codon:yes stop_codon:yes gene_type:complete
MIYIKTEEEVEIQRKSSLLVGKTLAEVAKIIRPGIKTSELDKVAETYICDNGAEPGFKGYGGFPATLCISVNDEVVHGIPSNRELKNGDIVSVDCGTYMNGFYGDSAYTFAVGEVKEEILLLLQRTKESLYLAIEQATVGKRVGDIGNAVQTYVEGFGYSVVRDLVGHGVGRNLHEKPEIPNYGRRGSGIKLKSGMCLAIEPMINLGVKEVVQDSDGWTIRTMDNQPSAHFEHDVVVRKGKADILSTFEYIEQELNNK